MFPIIPGINLPMGRHTFNGITLVYIIPIHGTWYRMHTPSLENMQSKKAVPGSQSTYQVPVCDDQNMKVLRN